MSEAELDRRMGENPLKDFLRHLATGDRIEHFNDFFRPVSDALVAATNNDHFVYTTVGATATTWAHVAHQSGIIRGVSGTTAATSGLEIHTPVMYSGDLYCGAEIRYRTSNIVDRRIEFGFASTQPTVDTAYVNSLVTPTFNTTANAAIYEYHNASATTTTGLYTIGTAITAAKTATTTNRPVNSTFQRIRMQLIVNRVFVWVDGVPLATAHNAGTTDYIEGGTLAGMTFKVLGTSTTDANNDVDYIRTWQQRL